MKSLYLAAGLALILHGLLFSLNADWLDGESVTNREQKTLSMTMTYRSPPKPLPEPVASPALKKPVQPEKKKKLVRPKIPVKPVVLPVSPLPVKDETIVEVTPDSTPYDMPDTEFMAESDSMILDQAPEGYDSGPQDIPEKMEGIGLNRKQGIVDPRAYEDNARPEYPGMARHRGYEGVVILEAA